MSVRFYCLAIDAADPITLGHWWARVLDWRVTLEDPEEVDIAAGIGPDGQGVEPLLTFVAVPDAKAGKNRLHIDLVPDDQAGEVERLMGLGAVRADVGQHDVSWVVLADPEGNEFCVLAAR